MNVFNNFNNLNNCDNFNLISFNCQGIKNILPNIAKFCIDSHVLFLQETWLMEDELCILNDNHPDFVSFSFSSVDSGRDVLVGRPYGGISILWKKSISHLCNVIQYDDDRLLGFSLKIQGLDYLFLNVYLPYF